ncbi:hypothetical protein [Streptomyces salinarius]|uniref:Uncharacterized protein n=1 Tax=Streptomyces salinarius TaxID=2762598 RepID=A0ABW8BNR1_9ACTN
MPESCQAHLTVLDGRCRGDAEVSPEVIGRMADGEFLACLHDRTR